VGVLTATPSRAHGKVCRLASGVLFAHPVHTAWWERDVRAPASYDLYGLRMGERGPYAKGQARREEILQAAIDVLSRDGLQHTSLRAIGREMGMQPAHILYYFSSREDLLQQVLVRSGEINAAAASASDGDYSLDDFVSAVRTNTRGRGAQLYLAFATEAAAEDHPSHEFFRERFAHVTQVLANAIDREIEEGSMPHDIEPSSTARLLLAAADGLQLQRLIDPSVDVPATLQLAIDHLRGAIDPANVPRRPASR
jgi:AcrR family transcriptional regulator